VRRSLRRGTSFRGQVARKQKGRDHDVHEDWCLCACRGDVCPPGAPGRMPDWKSARHMCPWCKRRVYVFHRAAWCADLYFRRNVLGLRMRDTLGGCWRAWRSGWGGSRHGWNDDRRRWRHGLGRRMCRDSLRRVRCRPRGGARNRGRAGAWWRARSWGHGRQEIGWGD
jgi:hypothetical protein